VDAGTVWGADVTAATARLKMLKECRVTWLEEPFHTSALSAYRELSQISLPVQLAGGEGAHNEYMAQQMIDYGGVGYIQIDPGRVGGITSAKRVADYALLKGVQFVNHTFTSHLALSAALQPYAGIETHYLCEYATDQTDLACELTGEHLLPDANGEIRLPELPGLGMPLNPQAVLKYLVDTEIKVAGRVIYRTPQL
jgi:L-alanine-DL-glutamate epimerase-like enolase superfamily enzyme